MITELYVDLDGVMANFEKRAIEISGIFPESDPGNKQLKRDFWKSINNYARAGNKFFEEMEMMPDAAELWEFLVAIPVPKIICSATGYIATAGSEKREWVRRHLGAETAATAIFVRESRMKAEHATPTRILIDDRNKSIGPWVDRGGIGVLHTSARDTIEQLKEYRYGV